MMKKKQSHWWSIVWIAVTLPLIGFSLMAFSKPNEAQRNTTNNHVKFIERPTSDIKPGDSITGCVNGQDGKPLPFANLVEEDEYHRVVTHAMTDKNGNYTFKLVNPKHKIRISYVGYVSKTLDINSNRIDVVLEPNMQITDVKVVSRKDSIDFDNPRYKEQSYPNETGVFHLVEQAPVFPGGQAALFSYLSMHLKYPSVAREMQVEADIVVRFTVDKTGFVRSPQIVNVTSETPFITTETMKAADKGDEVALETAKNYHDAVEAMKEEAIHVVRNMPRWEPGRQNGKRVETIWTLPISFKQD